MTDSDVRVLISAYACRPHMGSEAEVGWSMARELAKNHLVWVVTRSDNRLAIEAEMAKNPVSSLQFIYHNLPWTRWWNPGVQIHYYLWQLKTYFVARQLHHQINFDLVHHVTYVKYWSPSFLALLPIPFIWGPVGGADSTPKPFWRDFSWRGKAYETLRDWARWLSEYDPFVRLTAQRSVFAQATTTATAERLHYLGATNVHVASEVGLSSAEIADLAEPSTAKSQTLRVVSLGRLLHWKGFHLGLRAFAHAELPPLTEYWIMGQGPESNRLQALAKSLGIAQQVKFWGELSRPDVLDMLKTCHILLHPSLHESGGWVCIEAMASGLPILCLDLGGPATQVTTTTGIKVPVYTPEQTVLDLATAMTDLANDSTLRTRMGKAGQQRINKVYNWTGIAQNWTHWYSEILQQQDHDT